MAVAIVRTFTQYTVHQVIHELPGALVAMLLIDIRAENGIDRPGVGVNSAEQVEYRRQLAGAIDGKK